MATTINLTAAQDTTSPDYRELCDQLGVLSHVRFVKVDSAGRIGFTCGKPEECRALLNAVRECGYEPTPGLVAAAGR